MQAARQTRLYEKVLRPGVDLRRHTLDDEPGVTPAEHRFTLVAQSDTIDACLLNRSRTT